MTELATLKYRAFLSYAHADLSWGKWLHGRLEGYRLDKELHGRETPRGKVPSLLRPIFRDREDFSGGHTLTDATIAALDASAALIVLCSTISATRPAVNEEVRLFRSRHPDRPVIPVIIEGTYPDNFPLALRFAIGPNGTVTDQALTILGPDLREKGDGRELGLAKIVAGLMGLATDDLVRRAERARRRALRNWVAGLSVVALALAGLAVWAEVNRREAVRQQARAEEQTQIAEGSRAETQRTLATSDLRQGTQLLDSGETSATGIAFLARSARAGDERAMTRLWTLLQQRSFWVPTERQEGPVPRATPTAALPQDVAARFAKVDVDGQSIEPHSVAISPDGALILTSAGDLGEGIDTRFRLWRRDGTPASDWIAPPYSGNFHVSTIDGVFSDDGRHIGVTVNPWREPAYVLVYDRETLNPIGEPVESAGLAPRFQNASFSHVLFARQPSDGATLLITASRKGDAAAHLVTDAAIEELARTHHRTSVSTVAFDPGTGWLVSASDDGVVQVSDFGEPVGNPLRLDRAVTAIAASKPAGLALATTDGVRRYELLAPIATGPRLAAAPAPKAAACADWTQAGEAAVWHEPPVLLRHGSGRRLLRISDRQAGVASPGSSAPAGRSPVYPTDLALVCLDANGERIAITTRDFRTEVWSAGFKSRIGQSLDERRLFSPNNTPETTQAVELTADGRQALVRSFFRSPPNLSFYWFSLWDIPSGLLLMDRLRTIDGDQSEGNVRITEAELDAQGRHVLLIGNKPDGARIVVSSIEIVPPEAVRAILPDYAEAVSGVALDGNGLAEEVPDRARKLADGLKKLRSLGLRQ